MENPLPGQQKILENNWYLALESSNYLQRVGFSDSKLQIELQQYEIICADLNDHDPLKDPDVKSTEREVLKETMLDADGTFRNTGTSTRQDPSTGIFSMLDATIVHKSHQEIGKWLLCASVSSDHQSITLNLPTEQIKGQKRLA